MIAQLKIKDIDKFIDLKVDAIPLLKKDTGDRNRTSPFAFTGNRFEFRAVGSNQNVSLPLTILNTIMAESLEDIAKKLSRGGKNRSKLAVKNSSLKIIKSIITKHKKVIFNGDGYSEKWHKEAVKNRKLPQYKTTPEALKQLTTTETLKVFNDFDVLSETELKARQAIYFEQYTMKINVETNVAIKLAQTQVIPAGVSYLAELSQAGLTTTSTTKKVKTLVENIEKETTILADLQNKTPKNEEKAAEYAQQKLLVQLEKLRTFVDALEEIVPSKLWTLPSYQEMLFIR